MDDQDVTSMVLTGLYSGLTLDFAARSGVLASGATVKAMTGYGITRKTDSTGKGYDQVSVANSENETDPPSIVLSVYYTQDEGYDEVDLGVRFEDIPGGTEIEIETDQNKLSLPRQGISGSSLVASTGRNLGPIKTPMRMRLWLERPDDIKPGSMLRLTMSRVEGGGGGPVRKIVMQQIALDLSKT